MPTIRIDDFEGVSPRTIPRLLRPKQAQTAQDCRLLSGALSAWKGPLFHVTPARAGTKKSIHKYESVESGTATAGSSGSTLEDTGKNFTTLGVAIGDIVDNTTDGSSGLVTAVGTTTLTVTLVGGITNAFASADAYVVHLEKWMHWLTDVDVVRGPIPGDTTKRMYYTGDGIPKVVNTTLVDALAGAEYPTDSLTLGVPAPASACTPTVVNNSGTLASIVKPAWINITAVTNAAPARATAAGHGLVTGDEIEYYLESTYSFGGHRWSRRETLTATVTYVSATEFDIDETDTTNGATNLEGRFIKRTPALANDVGHGLSDENIVQLSGMTGEWTAYNGTRYRVTKVDDDYFTLNGTDDTQLSTSSGGTWTQVFEDAESRVYTYTYVSTMGEEGPPASASAIVEVGPGEQVDLTAILVQPAGDYDFEFNNIYRSLTAADGSTNWYFVAQIAVATTTYSDTLLPENLGEFLPSEGWVPPPSDLEGIVSMPNGIIVGFSKNTIRFCEPYQPHSWPIAYELTTEEDIVALGAFGSSLVVTTEGNPYLITGLHPSEMTMERLEISQSCVSKRGLADTGYAVVYPSPDGMMMIGPGVAKLITEDLFTRQEWQALNPSSIVGFFQDGRYLGFYDNGTVQEGFILDPKNPKASLTFTSVYATAGYNDPIDDALYLQIGDDIEKWDADATNLTYTWKSKVFVTPAPVNMAAAQVFADSYSTPITLQLEVDGVLRHTRLVYSNKPFRLPAGFLGEEFAVTLSGTVDVNQVVLADTMAALQIA